MCFKEEDHCIVEQVGCSGRRFLGMEFAQCYPAIGIDKGLLIDPNHPFDPPDIVGILTPQISWILSLNFTLGFTLMFGSLQDCQLLFRQHHAFLSRSGF